MKKIRRFLTGFTLPEILIGMTIMLIVMGAALTIYNMSQVSWTEGNAQTGLQRDASIAMAKMMRGINGNYGIMDAKANTVNVPNVTTVVFTGVDNASRSFYLSNKMLKYDGPTKSGYVIAKNVSGLEFSKEPYPSNRLNMGLGMQQMVKSRLMSVTLYTAAKVRN